MSKLAVTSQVPKEYDRQTFFDILFRLQQQVNDLAEGRIYARHAAASTAPSTGDYAQGDIVWNAGASSGGFVGWVCITGGTPGTWTTFGAIS